VLGELPAIDIEQPLAHGFMFVGGQRAESQPHQRMSAVGNLAAHGFIGKRLETFLRA